MLFNLFDVVLPDTEVTTQFISSCCSHLLQYFPVLSITFLYPLKTSESQWFSEFFRGYRNLLHSNGKQWVYGNKS